MGIVSASPQALPEANSDLHGPVLVGFVRRPFGKNGEARFEEWTDYAERFAAGHAVTIDGREFIISKSRPSREGRIVKLEGVDSREAVATLANLEIYVDPDELQPLPEGTYYHYELMDMNVLALDGTDLGKVTEIISTGANDVLVVQGPLGEVLLPVIGDVVKEINKETSCIAVELLPGLM